MKCPICEDAGRVRLSAPVLVEEGGVTASFSKWYPCPACPEGIKAEAEAVQIIERLKQYED